MEDHTSNPYSTDQASNSPHTPSDQAASETSRDEIHAHLKKEVGDVDVGTIEISLALVAIALVFTAVETPWVIRLFAIGAFLFGSHAARRLCWSYIILRAPIVFRVYSDSRWGTFAIARLYLMLVRRTIWRFGSWRFGSESKNVYEQEKSGYVLALLSLLVAFTFIWIAAVLWIAITVFTEIR